MALTRNGRVDTSANGTKNLAGRTDKVANTLDLTTNELGHRPLLVSAANANSEVLKKLTTLGSV